MEDNTIYVESCDPFEYVSEKNRLYGEWLSSNPPFQAGDILECTSMAIPDKPDPGYILVRGYQYYCLGCEVNEMVTGGWVVAVMDVNDGNPWLSPELFRKLNA